MDEPYVLYDDADCARVLGNDGIAVVLGLESFFSRLNSFLNELISSTKSATRSTALSVPIAPGFPAAENILGVIWVEVMLRSGNAGIWTVSPRSFEAPLSKK